MNRENNLIFDEMEINRLFGHEAADDEDSKRLREYYFKSSTYDQIATELPLRILVGHKGIGKSALFNISILEERERNELSIIIRPDDILSLGSDVSDFLLTIREWKKGLIEIIAGKILNAFGRYDEGVVEMFKKFSGKFIDVLNNSISEKIISFDPSKKALIDYFLKNNKVKIYIDDLDRGWSGAKNDVLRISALLNAVRDLARENSGLMFRISLRSDVYFLVRTSDESTDKIEGSVIWQKWTNHEILILLVKRILTYFGDEYDEDKILKMSQRSISDRYLIKVFEPRFSGKGHWENAPMYRVIMSLIRRRPRDLVKLCTLAARKAKIDKTNIIETKHLENSFEEYSQGRLQDTYNEYRSELPDIQRLLENMKPNKRERKTAIMFSYNTAGLLQKIDKIREQGEFKFFNQKIASNKELASFMYKINFLTARKEQGFGVVRKYFEENRYLSSQISDFGFDWEVHPAYRWALQPDNFNEIFQNLKLSEDD